MAQSVTLSTGSVFCGNPVTLRVRPTDIVNPSFHRIIVEVYCGISGGSYEMVKLFQPITTEGLDYDIDIASALRVPLDAYEYVPTISNPLVTGHVLPYVQWYVIAYDEYMDQNGDIHTDVSPVNFPGKVSGEQTYYRCLPGAFSDLDRLLAYKVDPYFGTETETKDVVRFTRKPNTSPEIMKVGEKFVYAEPLAVPASLATSATLTAPTLKEVSITAAGNQNAIFTASGCRVYAVAKSDPNDRTMFRFINSFGVLESISVLNASEEQMDVQTQEYIIARQESFSKFSRMAYTKSTDRETWKFSSGPLDKDWQQWFLHEFLMASNIWLWQPLPITADPNRGLWLRCHIVPEETISIIKKGDGNYRQVSFSVKLDITGSPSLTV